MRVAPQMVRSCCSPCASVSSSATRSGSWAPQAMRPHSSTHSSSSAGRLPPLMPPLVRQRSVGSSRRDRLPPTLPYRHLTATPFPAPHGTQSPCPASRPAVAWCRDHSPTTHLPALAHTHTHLITRAQPRAPQVYLLWGLRTCRQRPHRQHDRKVPRDWRPRCMSCRRLDAPLIPLPSLRVLGRGERRAARCLPNQPHRPTGLQAAACTRLGTA